MTGAIVSPTLFVRNVEPSYHAKASELDWCSTPDRALLLDKSRAVEFQTAEWSAWAVGRGSKAVTCQHVISTSIADGHDEQGYPWYEEVENRLFLPHASRYHFMLALENSIGIRILSPVEALQTEIGCPFFLVSSPNQKPSEHSVLVEFAVDGMNFLPDVRAFVRFYYTLDLLPKAYVSRNYPSIEERRQLTNFLVLASRMRPKPGQYFPIHVRQEQRIIPGVLVLEKRWGGLFSRNKRHFCARVYLSDMMECLPENIILYRRVEWHEKEVFHYEESPIARIVEPFR